jgi:hypothetical protein
LASSSYYKTIQTIAQSRQARVPFPARTQDIRKRLFAPNTHFITSTEAWSQSLYTAAFRRHTRYYTSSRKALSSAPKKDEKVASVKRLPSDKCKIEFFHSKYDFRDYNIRSLEYKDSREDMDDSLHNGIFTVHFHSTPIVKAAVEYYFNNSELVRQELEYYSRKTKRWKKFPFAGLKNDPEILYYKGKGSRPIPLRVRSEYEDDTSSDDERGSSKKNKKLIAIGEDKPKVMEMLYILNVIAQRLSRLEFRRTNEDKYKISSKFINMGEAISTSDWIMQQASIDEELSGIILRNPGALQHIVTCFAELDELWNHEKDPFVEEEDEMEKYRKATKPDIRHRGKKKKTKKKREEEKQKMLKKREKSRSSYPEEMYFA